MTNNIESQDRRKMITGLVASAAAATTVLSGGAMAETTPPGSLSASKAKGLHSVWNYDQVALVLIDYQPLMFNLIGSTPQAKMIELNARYLIRSAKLFNIPIILSTVGVKMGLNETIVKPILDEAPGLPVIDRSSMNSWDDPAFVAAVHATGRKRLVVGALWTEICLSYATVSMLGDGYEVMFPVDAVGGTSQLAHDIAIQRLIQAGAVPSTSRAAIQEWFRDWKNPLSGKPYHEILSWYKREFSKISLP